MAILNQTFERHRAVGAERRRHLRHDTKKPGTIWDGGRPLVATFVDISAGGARAHAPRLIRSGQEVVVELAGFGRQLAKVVRTGEESMGFQFASRRTLDLSSLGAAA